MQSGITASAELHSAFNNFTSDPSLFALPITITGESLTPLSPLPFTSSSFNASLPSLKPHLQPKTPIYLVLRPSASQSHGLVAVTHVPATAPVRQKMLFASTRTTLMRDLGLEKFGGQVFTTDEEEILEPAQWESRAGTGTGTSTQSSNQTGNSDILSREERELQSVKRAEEEERHGTQGRDLMGSGGSGNRLAMKITNDARSALATLEQDGAFVQLGIELASETLELVKSHTGVQAAEFLAEIPGDRPSYSFFHYPGTQEVLFLYTCPASSKVKERMVYASARASVLQAATGEGVNVSKRLEAGGVDEITEARLADEVGMGGGSSMAETSTSTSTSRQGFARPKRPGKR